MGKEERVRIWGVRAGLIGDSIAALPVLSYLERAHPGTYKYWAVHQKCAQAVPLFLNHPLIDRIKVTDGWVTEGPQDEELKKKCTIVLNTSPPVHDQNWRNEMDVIEQTARMAGIMDLSDVITPEERIPKLERWFPSYTFSNDPGNHGYIDIVRDSWANTDNNRVAIWPYAGYGLDPNRSPSDGWWEVMLQILFEAGFEVYHYGWVNDPVMTDDPRYHYMCRLSYMDQIRSALEAPTTIGPDTGALWTLGAYGQPTIALMTFHAPLHSENPAALAPPYKNTHMLFNAKNINLNKHKAVMDELASIIPTELGRGVEGING